MVPLNSIRIKIAGAAEGPAHPRMGQAFTKWPNINNDCGSTNVKIFRSTKKIIETTPKIKTKTTPKMKTAPKVKTTPKMKASKKFNCFSKSQSF